MFTHKKVSISQIIKSLWVVAMMFEFVIFSFWLLEGGIFIGWESYEA